MNFKRSVKIKFPYIFLLITCFYNKIFLCSANQDIIESGKAQYQLLKEKGNLPHYGSCWKQGVEHLEQGCRYLREDTQSEIALHFTNCFLKMSGHDTYNCDSDKKTNLRAICINTMSDRAFNVYTEFYTHIQNMCGFIQGHVWHEMIAENTMNVGKKLKETVQNQEGLLQAQQESLKLQEKMLQHGRILENVLDDLFLSFKTHQDVLNILSNTVSNLQDWIVGEMSWFDSIIFYTISVILVFIFTSHQRTSGVRLIIFFLLFVNLLIERLICSVYIFLSSQDTTTMHSNVNSYIWFSRYAFMVFTIILLIYFALYQIDPFRKQYELLYLIQEQNRTILSILNKSKSIDKSYLDNINELSKNDKNLVNQLQEYSDLDKSEEMLNVTSKGIKKQNSLNNSIKSSNKSKHIVVEKYNLRSNSRSSSLEPSIL